MKVFFKIFIAFTLLNLFFSNNDNYHNTQTNHEATQEAFYIVDNSSNNTTIAEKMFYESCSICQNTLDFIKSFGEEVIERTKRCR